MRDSIKNEKKSFTLLQKSRHWLWIAAGVIFILFVASMFWITRDLPSLTELEHFEPRLVTKVFSADSVVIKEFFTKRRDYVLLKDIPKTMQRAIIDIEDRKFYSHWGIDLKRFTKAAILLVTHFGVQEGASTLTQQLATDLYYNKRDKYSRKIKEIFTAIQIERTYSKPEILEMYLNHIYFGHGNWGLKAATEYFFNKKVRDLNLEECALLAGVINLPEYYSPVKHPERAKRRRNLVLYVMWKNGDISEETYRQTSEKKIVLGGGKRIGQTDIAPYFTEYIRQKLDKIIGAGLYSGGYSIYTTLDSRAQAIAEKAVHEKLDKLQKNMQNRLKNKAKFKKFLDKFVPDPMEQEIYFTNRAKKDSLIDTKAAVQAALISVDPRNGHILAMVGGRDFNESKWNRAVQMKRQPGSSFKPFIYTAVIDNGYSPTFEILNQPVVLFLPGGKRWIPRNFDRDQSGPMMLRDALKKSKNLVSVRILQKIVKPSVVVKYAHRMGISTNLRAVDALALGTSEVIPMEITSAYGVFANKGIHVKPMSITKVVNRRGEVVYREIPESEEALSEETAYIMCHMLQTVVNEGTGVTARTVYDFRRPAGGKTGTTDDYTDAWFVGFTPQIATGVWVGLDNPSLSIGPNQTGAAAALPIWAKFMKATHDTLNLPIADFIMPDGVVKLKICRESKQIATEYCPEVIEEVFRADLAPTKECEIHSGRIGRERERKKKRIIF